MMKFILPIIALFIAPSAVFASCAASSFTELKDRADVVAVGTVQKIEQPLGGGTQVTVNLETLYRGSPSTPITIASESGQTLVTSIDVDFIEDKEYLLFLKENEDGTFSTNACDGTRALAEQPITNEESKILGAGKAVTATSAESKKITMSVIAILALGVIAIAGVAGLRWKKNNTQA